MTISPTTRELADCPFCAAEPVEFVGTFGTTITCNNGDCGVRQTGATRADAARRWNTRQPMSEEGWRELAEESLYHLRLDARAKDYHDRVLAAMDQAPQAKP